MNSFEKPQFYPKPESKETENSAKKYLLKAFRKGLHTDGLGYHGTSLESIKYTLEKGHLPGMAQPELNYPAGTIFFFPSESGYPELYKDSKYSEINTLEYTKDYADFIAKYHYIAQTLGLDLKQENSRDIAKALARENSLDSQSLDEAEEAVDLLIERGFNPETVRATQHQARERKGIILCFDKKALREYENVPGDDNSHIQDQALVCPDGLKPEYISGLYPLSQEEKDFFEQLKKEK